MRFASGFDLVSVGVVLGFWLRGKEHIGKWKTWKKGYGFEGREEE